MTLDGKKHKGPVKRDEEAPERFRDLILFPTMLGVGTVLVAFVLALIHGGPEVFEIAVVLILILSLIYFSVTLVVGGVVLAPSSLRWARKAFARRREPQPASSSSLWDDWVDGP